MGKLKKIKSPIIKEERFISFETFRKIGSYEQPNLKSDNPTCFNGDVRIRKYKVTIELIEEPKDVIANRLQELWDNCDNHHHTSSLRFVAKEIGYELNGDYGNKKRK